MDGRKVAICGAAGFIFIFVFDVIFHGMMLQSAYQMTAHMWRSPDMMQKLMPYAILGQMIFSIMAAILFTYGYQGRGRPEGVKFGFYLGTLLAGLHLICFTYLPLIPGLLFSWMAGDYLKSVGLGLLFVALHAKK